LKFRASCGITSLMLAPAALLNSFVPVVFSAFCASCLWLSYIKTFPHIRWVGPASFYFSRFEKILLFKAVSKKFCPFCVTMYYNLCSYPILYVCWCVYLLFCLVHPVIVFLSTSTVCYNSGYSVLLVFYKLSCFFLCIAEALLFTMLLASSVRAIN